MSNGDDIAAQVEAALIEAATATGSGPLYATLCRKGTPTGPEYDQTPGAPTKHSLTMINDTISLGLIDGSMIRATDKLIVVAATGAVPTTADTVVLGAPENVTLPADNSLPGLSVEMVKAVAPGGTTVLYEVLLRG